MIHILEYRHCVRCLATQVTPSINIISQCGSESPPGQVNRPSRATPSCGQGLASSLVFCLIVSICECLTACLSFRLSSCTVFVSWGQSSWACHGHAALLSGHNAVPTPLLCRCPRRLLPLRHHHPRRQS